MTDNKTDYLGPVHTRGNKVKKTRIKKSAIAAIEEGSLDDLVLSLTAKQASFVREYLVDFNGTRAATAAGFSPNSVNRCASALLRHPAVRKAIDLSLAARSETVDVDINYVLKTITRAIEKADKQDRHGEVLRGAELLAKYLGMFVERKDITVEQNINYKKIEEDSLDFMHRIDKLVERSAEALH